MANGESANERATVTMRRVSPCEHGVHHSTLSVAEGVTDFSTPDCKDSKGNARNHHITPEKYPTTYRRR